MSFLLDPPMLFAAGVLIERRLPAEQRDLAEAATLGVFFGGSFALYQDVPGLQPLWRPFGASGGRDFMWNSGVFGVGTGALRWPMHAAAGAIFATYPLWLKVGRRRGRRLNQGRRGRRLNQGRRGRRLNQGRRVRRPERTP